MTNIENNFAKKMNVFNRKVTVNTIGSDSLAHCKTILGVVQKDPETNPFVDKLTVFQDIETILFDKYRLRSDDASAASLEIIEIVCKHLTK
tara:strand:- start:630 stop:902 length:273 start_codon:yes stop_codon:yes gene_type:complete